MSGVSISDAVATKDGVEFTATRDGVVQRFLAHREALQDLDYSYFESETALLKAFHRHQGQVANVAGKALNEGRRGSHTVVLQSLL
jgi:uncharacterized protein DUF1488